MTSSQPSAVPPFPIGRIDLNMQGQTIPFDFPATGDMERQLAMIFQAKEYPALDLPTYQATLIVDIGANIGASALYFKGLFPDARIVCFEPSPTNTEFLRRNTRLLQQVEVHPFGLADFSDAVPLYVGKAQLMQNSIFPNEGVRSAHELAQIRDAGTEFDRLDLRSVSILKLDAEGCELPILRSLGTRRNAIEIIYLEYHSESDRLAIDRLLEGNFMLARAVATTPHRGSNVYVNTKFAAAYEHNRIRRSDE